MWRPALDGLQSKHYDADADKALPAVPLGLIGHVGSVGEQRFAMLTEIVCADLQDPGENQFITMLLDRFARGLEEDEIAAFDAGFRLQQLFEANIRRFVACLPKNFTARRNYVLSNPLGYPAEYGELVCPLARTYDDKSIVATPPDRVETWFSQGLEYRVAYWDELVLPDCKANPANSVFFVVAIYDPHFDEPWLLACPQKLSGKTLASCYHDRWPVEQLPLAAKHMVGANRQFVFAPESCQHLPELALLAGSILTCLAAIFPPIPTGFWDRTPKRTPGCLRHLLARVHFPNLPNPLPSQIRKKASVCAYLPKRTQAHRRQERIMAASPS